MGIQCGQMNQLVADIQAEIEDAKRRMKESVWGGDLPYKEQDAFRRGLELALKHVKFHASASFQNRPSERQLRIEINVKGASAALEPIVTTRLASHGLLSDAAAVGNARIYLDKAINEFESGVPYCDQARANTESSIQLAAYAWLGLWRDQIPAEAVTDLQKRLGPLSATQTNGRGSAERAGETNTDTRK